MKPIKSKGYRDIMYYVCTPVYVRCRDTRHCVRSTPKICNGVKNCMNKWNSSNDCIHLKRKLYTLSNDVNVVQNAPARFIGLFFTAFHFYISIVYQITSVETEQKINFIFHFFIIFYRENRSTKVLCF